MLYTASGAVVFCHSWLSICDTSHWIIKGLEERPVEAQCEISRWSRCEVYLYTLVLLSIALTSSVQQLKIDSAKHVFQSLLSSCVITSASTKLFNYKVIFLLVLRMRFICIIIVELHCVKIWRRKAKCGTSESKLYVNLKVCLFILIPLNDLKRLEK